MATSALRTRPAWASLKNHYQKMRRVHLRQLFDKDRERGERMAVEVWRSSVKISQATVQ